MPIQPERTRLNTPTMVAAALLVFLVIGAYAIYSFSMAKTQSAAPLILYSADSYSAEAQALLNGFSSSTGASVAPVKSGGSFALANQIAAGAPDDVFISVSLSAASPTYLKNLSSNWAVGFASDQLVLAFSNASPSVSSVTSGIIAEGNAAARSNSTSDWNAFFSSLTSGRVKVGISDPIADPAGLRAWLLLEAAGAMYASGDQGAYLGQLMRNNGNVTGAHAAALVAPLQSGQIQFLFIYRSAAVTDHLDYLSFDRHVNLGDPALGPFYANFSYTDSAGKTTGAPIILSVTVPLSAANGANALGFVRYVVKNSGMLSSYGLQPLSPARLYHNAPPPAPIAQLVSQGLAVESGGLR